MRFRDRTGERHGALEVLSRAPNVTLSGRSRVHFMCRCDCGAEVTVAANALSGGQITSCGCGIHRAAKRAVDLTGKRFGMLTAVERIASRPGLSGLWRCVCDCGNDRTAGASDLTAGHTTNCGCKRRTHGHSYVDGKATPTYSSWRNMIARCTNPKASGFDHYDALGVVVWAGWNKFEQFLSDMGEAPPNTTIERIDNDGPYEPGNCRWATRQEQANNRRTNIRFEYRGKSYTLAQLARATGQAKETLRVRLVRPGGWAVAAAVETPTIPRHLRRATR